MTRKHWGRAGVPLSDEERALARRRANRANIDREAFEARSRSEWERGLVRPFAITWALDSQQLDGPEVDRACGVEEPTVDEWEAGTRYPTWEQLKALAALTNYPLSFFTIDREYATLPDKSSMRFHIRDYAPTPVVDAYDPDVWQQVTGA